MIIWYLYLKGVNTKIKPYNFVIGVVALYLMKVPTKEGFLELRDTIRDSHPDICKDFDSGSMEVLQKEWTDFYKQTFDGTTQFEKGINI